MESLSNRSLRSRISKHDKKPDRLEWEEVIQLENEVQKRIREETNNKQIEKWMNYHQIIAHLKDTVAQRSHQRNETGKEEGVSEDSMSELNDYHYDQDQERSLSPRSDRNGRKEERIRYSTPFQDEEEHEEEYRNERDHRRRETIHHQDRREERPHQHMREREKRSDKGRGSGKRSKDHRRARDRYQRDEEDATRKSRKRRYRRTYLSSEEEDEEVYTSHTKRKRSVQESQIDYSFIDAMETFDGDFSKWALFRDVVEELVLNSRKMKQAMKIAIVNKLLKGNAHSIWNNKVAGSKDIEAGWKALINHYEDPRRIDAYLHGLVAKMPMVTHDADVKALQEMYAQVMNFKALTDRLGQDRGAQARELCLIMANRFWNSEAKKIKKDFHTIPQLAERVEKLLRDAQILTLYHKEPKPSGAHKPFQPRISNLNLKKKCNFCASEGHWSSDCDTSMSFDEKRRIISEKRLCGKCCRVGHFASQCRSRTSRCNTCGKDHATALHGLRISFLPPQNVSIAEQITETGTEQIEETEVRVSLVQAPKAQSFWTKTRFNGYTLNTLIDTGADITLISEGCVPKYARNLISPLIVQGFGPQMSTVLREVANIELKMAEETIRFEAYLSTEIKNFTLIIGRDQIKHFLQKENRILRTVFGEYDFESNQWSQTEPPEVSCNQLQIWYEKEEEEKVEEAEINMIVEKLASGRYEARLPFLSKGRPRQNYRMAVAKHEKLLERLKSANRLQEYEQQIMDLVQRNHAEEIHESTGHFIGHRAVERPEAASTRFRVVLTPLELNELLWKGDARGLDVLGHLLRFRIPPFVFTADLQKAFLQIQIHQDDRPYLRFLWTTKGILKHFQMAVLPFGIVSAPAILTKVVEMIMEEMESPARETLQGAVYMDDIIAGTGNRLVLEKIIQQAQAIFEISGFHLHKVRSNTKMSFLPEDAQEECKVLGIYWAPQADQIRIHLPNFESPLTRRELLSLIGKIFDPFGVYDPCKLALRLIHSRIVKCGWDDPLETNILVEINEQLSKLREGKEVVLSRTFKDTSTLWCFADASQGAYGYVLYLGEQFLFGKAKLFSSTRSIVDKELQALFELVKAIPKILNYLRMRPTVHILSDSQVNLDRLVKSPNEQPIVEARRLLSILKIVGNIEADFYHIKGVANPADCFSRPQELKKAAKWLQLNVATLSQNMSQRIPVKLVCHIQRAPTDERIKSWLEKRSLSQQLALIWRIKLWYRRSTKKAQAGRQSPLENLVYLYQGSSSRSPPGCKLINGLWHYITRNLDRSPMWTPPDSSLAQSLLSDAHHRSFHRGLDMSIAMVPESIQVQNGNRLMRKIISRCVKCRRERAKGIQQPLGPLHYNQVQPCKAFEDIVMDCFGPMKLANGKKYWGLVSVCRTSQAVRLNPIEDLTKDTLLAVLMHQWGQVGFPKRIHSDHGSNFMAVRKWISTHPSIETMNIYWSLSTPNAPWMNGKSEKMVHVTKACLSHFAKPPKSHLDALRRFGSVEKVINSRPVLAKDGEAISAFEIAFNRKLVLNPNEPTTDQPQERLQQMRKQEIEMGLLWKSQYLKKAERYYPRKGSRVEVDDVFLVPDIMRRRLQWATARVKSRKVGSDGICRSVVLLFPGGEELERPVQGLIPLTSSPSGN